jgi:uncharacterized membrane protein
MSRARFLLAVALLALATASCDSEGAVAEDSGPTPGEVPPLAERYEDFDPTNFDATSIDIDNPYLPLAPGTRLVHEGVDIRAGKKVPHRIDFIVTDVTQVVNGVRTVVIWERDFVRNALEEAELTYFAQDIAGNVWHLGQYSEIYEGEEMVGATGFLPGHLDGAKAGIMMQADPRPGTPSYSEGYGPPPIYWTDRARVVANGKRATVPAGTYDDVLVIEEYSEQERTGFQLKYYAPGVGNVRVGWRGKDASRETLELVKVTTLDEAQMARARAEVRELEQRARQYGSTPPSEVR